MRRRRPRDHECGSIRFLSPYTLEDARAYVTGLGEQAFAVTDDGVRAGARLDRPPAATTGVGEIGYWIRAAGERKRHDDARARPARRVGADGGGPRSGYSSAPTSRTPPPGGSPRRRDSGSRGSCGAPTGTHGSDGARTGRSTRSYRMTPRDPGHRRPQRRAAARVAKRGVSAGAERRRPPRSRAHAGGRHRRGLLRDLRSRGRLRERSARGRRRHGRRLGGAVRRGARRSTGPRRWRRRSPR